jgi:uncharacterized caspase-like protein
MFRFPVRFLALGCALLALGILHLSAEEAVHNKIALVIGNDSYQHVASLRNARADARAIARAFERVGYRVQLKLDVNEKNMKDAIRAFKAQVAGGDVAVFYFSGHGVQLGGANYLLPVDIRGDNEDQVRDDSVPLQRVLDDLHDQKAQFSLAIIDACRNNPFKGAGRALAGRGLAVTAAATGQMVLFSAGAGQQALDSLGPADKNPNGVFTRVLLKEMDRPGVPVDRVLRNVRDEVVRLAQGAGQEQVPALYDQALGEFYFIPGAPAPAPGALAPAPSVLGAPPAASALVGGLQVAVNVPGAVVYLDGTRKGEASPTEVLNLRDLPAGSVSVKVEAPGYLPATQALVIQEGQWIQAKFVLVKGTEAPAQSGNSQWGLLGSVLKKTPTPAQPGSDGTPLSRAAMKGDVERVKGLVEAGGGVNDLDKWGWTALHWAVYYSKHPVIDYLLDHGADPNAKTVKSYSHIKAGSTPLIITAYYGYAEPMAALLKNGADRSLADGGGKTALDYATQFRFEECQAMLQGKPKGKQKGNH